MAQFRRLFWVMLVLVIPVVAFNDMFAHLMGYQLPDAEWVRWVSPVLGTVVYVWGGWPFLAGGVAEVRSRQPGMMLLIAMAITVAYGASMATSLDWLDLDFWWELAGLVTIMLLGHWQEMRAVGQAHNALDALAALLPDEAELDLIIRNTLRRLHQEQRIDIDITRKGLQTMAAAANVPLVSASVSGWTALLSTTWPGETGLGELMNGRENGSELSQGIPSPVVGFAASLQAAEVIRILAGASSALRSKLLVADLAKMRFSTVSLEKRILR